VRAVSAKKAPEPEPSRRELDLERYDVTSDRVLTIPNLLSFARIALVPVFLWLLLVPRETWSDLLALLILGLSAFTDWLDGYLARRWNQITRIGQLLDPVADRLYIVATVVAFVLRDIIPLWFAVLIVARDVVLALVIPVLRHYGLGPLPVHFLGKAATFNLLYALPLLLLGEFDGVFGTVALVFGWAFAVWGAGLYWAAAALYIEEARRQIRVQRALAQAGDEP
jgi:cardiolipin synthase (CMP-forming)